MTLETTLVGSYPTPLWLRQAPSQEGLRDATAAVLHLQEQAGIDLLTDGELSRFDPNHPETNGMIEYFVRPLAGVRADVGRTDAARYAALAHLGFRQQPAGVVEAALAEGTLDLVGACHRSHRLTTRPFKFTLTSPYMLARSLLDDHYGSLRELCLALADVLASQAREFDAGVVQIDEANLPGRAEDAPLAAEAVNRILDAVPGRGAVHLCFGNYGGQRIQQGRLAGLVPFLDALRCDHVVLEAARYGSDELRCLRELPDLRLGVGVIDIKDTQIESPDEVARRVEAAAGAVGGAERIVYLHPDCGFWMLPRGVADGKIRALVAGRDRYLGR